MGERGREREREREATPRTTSDRVLAVTVTQERLSKRLAPVLPPREADAWFRPHLSVTVAVVDVAIVRSVKDYLLPCGLQWKARNWC